MSKCFQKFLIFVFIFIFFFQFFTFCISATINFQIANPINQSDEIEVDVDISGLTTQSCAEGICYFQGVFQKSEGENYFGYTQNNSGDWNKYVSSPDIDFIKNNFFNFEPIEGSWSGKLKIKNDFENSIYKGPGSYLLKILRYSGKSKSSSGESNILAVDLNYLVQLVDPTLEPTSSPTSSPSNSPTVTPTPTLIATKSPTPKSTKSPTSKPEENINEGAVMGIQDDNVSPTPDDDFEEESKKPKVSILAIVFVILGVSFVGFSGFAFFRKKGFNNNEDGKNKEVI